MADYNLTIINQDPPTDPRFQDITGKRFGNLTVLGYLGLEAKFQRIHIWLCKCDCGAWIPARRQNLGSGHTTRCLDCSVSSANEIHNYIDGRGSHPLYGLWYKILNRCENPTDKHYHHYGQRGITVCSGWHDFWAFVQDLPDRPSFKHTIDRIDNNGGYWCGHCDECVALKRSANFRWATQRQQLNNQRRNVRVTINGRTQTLMEWSKETGLNYKTLQFRVRQQWDEQDLLQPAQPSYDRKAYGLCRS